MIENILAAIRGEYGSRSLPPVGTIVDDIYTVIVCPICGHKTLDNYDICCHCGWEYDGLPEDQYSAANGATLEEYREEYKKIIEETNNENV